MMRATNRPARSPRPISRSIRPWSGAATGYEPNEAAEIVPVRRFRAVLAIACDPGRAS